MCTPCSTFIAIHTEAAYCDKKITGFGRLGFKSPPWNFLAFNAYSVVLVRVKGWMDSEDIKELVCLT